MAFSQTFCFLIKEFKCKEKELTNICSQRNITDRQLKKEIKEINRKDHNEKTAIRKNEKTTLEENVKILRKQFQKKKYR